MSYDSKLNLAWIRNLNTNLRSYLFLISQNTETDFRVLRLTCLMYRESLSLVLTGLCVLPRPACHGVRDNNTNNNSRDNNTNQPE